MKSLFHRIQKAGQSNQFSNVLIITLLTNIILAGMGLVSGTFVARLLGPAGRGELAAIQTWPNFLALVAVLGLSDALVFFSAKDPAHAARYTVTAICVAIFSSIPFIILGYELLPIALKAQTVAVVDASRWYLWILPLSAVVGMFPHPLRGINDVFSWNFVRLLPGIAWISVLVLGYFQGVNQAGALSKWYLYGFAITGIPMILVLARRLRGEFKPAWSSAKPMLMYGLPSAASNFPSMLNLRLDQMLMVWWFSADVVGWYVVAFAWGNAIYPILVAVAGVLLPRVASAPSMQEKSRLLVQGTRMGGFLSIGMAGLASLSTPIMIPLLFGHEYSPSIPAGIILSIAGGFLSLNQTLEAGALGLGESRYVLWAESIGFISTLVFLSIFLIRYQIIGAALASLLSYVTITLVLLVLLSRKTGYGIMELVVPQKQDMDLLRSRLAELLRQVAALRVDRD